MTDERVRIDISPSGLLPLLSHRVRLVLSAACMGLSRLWIYLTKFSPGMVIGRIPFSSSLFLFPSFTLLSLSLSLCVSVSVSLCFRVCVSMLY